MPKTSIIVGCASLEISDSEIKLLRDINPWGFILFARNLRNPGQLRRLLDQIREIAGTEHPPILIDQEGGRVSRFPQDHWRVPPSPTLFAATFAEAPDESVAALEANYHIIAHDLRRDGLTVNCAPMIDVVTAGADPIMTSRALGSTPEQVSRLGRAIIDGQMKAGILPVIKHAPGHGRATVDSHKSLPTVDATAAELSVADFQPFRSLKDAPMMMTAHIVYTALDRANPATLSPAVIQGAIRQQIGYRGLVMTDDLSMGALGGSMRERAEKALAAGCDMLLHCSGEADEMRQAAEAAVPLAGDRLARAEAVEAAIKASTLQVGGGDRGGDGGGVGDRGDREEALAESRGILRAYQRRFYPDRPAFV